MLDRCGLTGHHTVEFPLQGSSMIAQPDPTPTVALGQWEDALNVIAVHRDKQMYAELFKYFAPRLRAFGIKMFGNEQQAMEMVQDTMLNVWQKAALFDASRGCASTWIFTIARNVRFDMLRKKQSRKDDISADDLWSDGDYPEQEGSHSQQWDLHFPWRGCPA